MVKRQPLRPALVAWLWWIACASAIDAWAFGSRPDLVSSAAYTWATDLLPATVWAWLFGACSLGAALSIYTRNHWIARVTLVVHAICHVIFGASILYLTLEGTTSAVTGASKWWALAFADIVLLALPSLRAEQKADGP